MNRQSVSRAQKPKDSTLLSPNNLLQRKTINRTDFCISTVDTRNPSGEQINILGLPGVKSQFSRDFTQIPVRLNSRPLPIQAKLKIDQPNDKYEQEADRVAEHVMRMPDSRSSSSVGSPSLANSTIPRSGTIQRVCSSCSKDEELIQAKKAEGVTPEVTPAIKSGIQSLQGGGHPLSGSERIFFEPRFGVDFSKVRVHNDTRADGMARSVNARAFTHRRNIVFGAGEYSSDSLAGRKLLAHELTHVVQQNGAGALFSASENSGKIIPTSQELSIVPLELIRRKPPDSKENEKKDEPKWENDYYYDKEDKAQRRVEKLKEEWTDARYHEIKVKGETNWQVQKLGPRKEPAKKGASKKPKSETKKKDEDWTPDTKNFEKREDAEVRKKELKAEDEWEDYRVNDLKEGEKTFYRVEFRGKLKLGTTEFALTFDDGPHSASLGKGANRTEKVLDALAAEGIWGKGAFFVQTHAPSRGSTVVGKKLIERMFKEGYTVGIHTGGKKDHESHTKAQRAGRLEGELQGAKSHLKGISGSDPDLVRAPFGKTNAKVREVYKKLKLKHLHWDIDGDPGGSHPLAKLRLLFDTGLEALKRGSKGTFHPKPTTGSSRIVVLYHDIRKGTSNHIGAIVKYIKKRVPKAKFQKP